MPYKSDAQRRYFHANRAKLEAQGVNVSEWDRASKGKKLPERAKENGGSVWNRIFTHDPGEPFRKRVPLPRRDPRILTAPKNSPDRRTWIENLPRVEDTGVTRSIPPGMMLYNRGVDPTRKHGDAIDYDSMDITRQGIHRYRYGLPPQRLQEGGEVEEPNPWEQLPQSPEGRPQITVTKPTVQPEPTISDVASRYGRQALDYLTSVQAPAPIKLSRPPERGLEFDPSYLFGQEVRKAGSSILEGYKEYASPHVEDAEGTDIEEPGSERGKVKPVLKDPINLGMPVVGEVISNLAGVPGKGIGWGLLGKAVTSIPGIARRGVSIAERVAQEIKTPPQAIEWLQHHFGGDPIRDWGYSNKNDYLNLARYYAIASEKQGLTPRQVREADIFRLSQSLDEGDVAAKPEIVPETTIEAPRAPEVGQREIDDLTGSIARIQGQLKDPKKIAEWRDLARDINKGIDPLFIDDLKSDLGSTPTRLAESIFILSQFDPKIADRILKPISEVDAGLANHAAEELDRLRTALGKGGPEEPKPWPEPKEQIRGERTEADFWRPSESDWESLSRQLEEVERRSGAGPTEEVPHQIFTPTPEKIRQNGVWKNYIRQANLSDNSISKYAVPYLEKDILPHYSNDLKKFLDHYFAGMYNPQGGIQIGLDYFNGGMTAKITNPLDPSTGRPLGVATISRVINPEEKFAKHALFKLPDNKQASGIAKNLLRNQVELYQKMGLNRIETTANIDVGGYAWAKYGFLPYQDDWNYIRERTIRILQREKSAGKIDPVDVKNIISITSIRDPKAMWALSDYNVLSPYNLKSGKPKSWAQELLLGSTWEASFNLKDPATMTRFNDYIAKKAKE